MRILLACPSYPPYPCGVGDYTAHMAARFRAAGDEAFVITSRPDRNEAFVHAAMPENWTLLNIKSLINLTKDIQPDLVHFIYPAAGYRHGTIAMLPRLIRKHLPTLPVCVSLDEITRMRPRIRMELLLAGLGSHCVIIGTQYDRHEYQRWQQRWPTANHNVVAPTVIPTGTNILVCPDRTRQEVRAKLGLPENAILFMYFGLVRPDKGLDTLLSAFEQISAQHPNIHLALFCNFDRRARDDESALRYRETMFHRMKQIQSHNPNLHHPGYLERPEDVSSALLAADFGVLPFRSGASEHSSTLQAMLIHGLPIISTIGWITPSEIANLIIPAPTNDAAGVAKTIEHMLSDHQQVELTRTRAKAWAQAHDWPMITQQYRDLYQQLIHVYPSGKPS